MGWSNRGAYVLRSLWVAAASEMGLAIGRVPVFPGRCKLRVSEWLERIRC